jgi:hypothetical protein
MNAHRHSYFIVSLLLTIAVLPLASCGKSKEQQHQDQVSMQVEKARIELQKNADELARNPPPELIKAAQEAAAKANKSNPGK